MSTPAEARTAADSAPVSAVEQRLAELGLSLPEVAAPVAAYVPAVISGNHVYTSGQLPFINGKLEATGKVAAGAEATADEPTVSPEDAKKYAAVCAVNALAAVKSVIGDLDRITRIVKVVGFVSSDPTFTGQPAVINGASELLGRVLGDAGQHARSAVGVAVLPLDAPVEVELIAEFS
ncbi:RidA family protein [Pseudarthrobacter enclensis]|jgi:enamine deaminase RidA (YjgF/YER057c/UK114 family)|uniref:LysR family transcriptional regulator n=1 Tax=Pseudarthrobacter enclensis TaxID=993070 RepID=A0A0V8IV01_9MICC|nr:RidA family protein [Pseudarthrobacter enclensis]KSU78504.1 LysR family transcriptional regulator [Pseudarthrobacter enclensis]BCW20411.1 LysR family transcriptional regulator [Arthrobacter sp. NtRootA9]SCB72214.1 Enamine deaminase RidA, house cleaning of reactive enamine intermediates, YjgF/YER057c/UK114 family [Pseudarthrobacter enclensis]